MASAAEKLSPIFDGKTLQGWRQCNGTARYYVEKGELVGVTAAGSPNSFLCSEKEYGDFILEFEVKDDPALNSGVQIRSHRYQTETTVLTENKGKNKRTHAAARIDHHRSNAERAGLGDREPANRNPNYRCSANPRTQPDFAIAPMRMRAPAANPIR